VAAGALLIAVPACSRPAPVVVPPAPSAGRAEGMNQQIAAATSDGSTNREYLVGADDLLEVSLFDIEDKDGEPRALLGRVSQSGEISLPLVGTIEVAGLSALQIEERLREHYRTYIHKPQITVFVKEYRSYRISVVGYVAKPGLYEVSGQKTLLEVLSLAGGLNDDAGTMVEITRSTDDGVRLEYIDLDQVLRAGDLALNAPLHPGDVVNVPRAGVFYVAGSVVSPGAYPLRRQVTVTQALATAGGPNQRVARLGGTTLYRNAPGGTRQEVPIDLDAIQEGRVEDPQVVENDIIVVPMNHLKYVAEVLVGRVGLGIPLN
jgi:polysaccharide export outer membrane protein